MKSFEVHTDQCPTGCSLNTDIEDILDCYGHNETVTKENLESMKIGDKIRFCDFVIERMK